jgi:cytochrome c
MLPIADGGRQEPLPGRRARVPYAVRFAALLLGAGTLLSAPIAQAGCKEQDAAFTVLVFSKTAAFRHLSIAPGIAAIRALGEQHGFRVDAGETAGAFTDANLARYRVVVFLNTTGDVLDADQQAAFERFIRRGGGFAGIHSATDTEYEWPWYGRLVGTYFRNHPAIQSAVLRVIDATHPSTRHLPAQWTRTDEWYNFRFDPSAQVHVLLEIDEETYGGGSMGARHPMAWYHEYDGGRAWYTALGHTNQTYEEPLFLQHLLGGLRWVAGVTCEPMPTEKRKDGR